MQPYKTDTVYISLGHILIACVIQLITIIVIPNLWLGSLLATSYFIGRELAQAEHRVIQEFYGNKRANAPWWCGFEPRAWTIKGILDWFLPMLVTGLVAIIFN